MLSINFACLFVLLFCAGAESQCSSNYVFYEEVGASIAYHEIPRDWDYARLHCAAEGAVLLSPNFNFTNTILAILNDSSTQDSVFTGIRFCHFTGEFKTLEGIPLFNIPHRWATERGEPNNANDKEDCIIINHKDEMEIVDCDKKYPYFCYKDFEKDFPGKYIEKQYHRNYGFYQESGAWISYHEMPLDWDRARLKCAAEGARLASPILNYRQTIESILNTRSVGEKAFTGIRLSHFTGDFQTLEGIPLYNISHRWASVKRESTISNGEDCITLNKKGEMEAEHCGLKYPYFCYRESEWSECGKELGYKAYSRFCSCYKMHTTAQTWDNAQKVCEQEGGHLAIINSDAEAQVIKQIVSDKSIVAVLNSLNTGNVRVGIHYVDGQWKTIDGETLAEAGYAKWSSGKPESLQDDQRCGGVGFGTDVFDVGYCDRKSLFICEKRTSDALQKQLF